MFLDHCEGLLRNAPTPIVMKRQRRSSLSRFTLGHLLGNVEVYCQLSRGKLQVAYRNPWKMRDLLQANLISEAIALLGFTSLPPFYLNTGDKPGQTPARSNTVFANCSLDGYADVAAPDFVFNGWHEAQFVDYDAKARLLAEASATEAVHDRAFWTGRGDIPARAALLEISLTHAESIEAVDALPNYDPGRNIYLRNFKPLEEQLAQYRYMIDVEGFGYSGRLKLLLHARRAVLVLDRPYREFFQDGLEPFRHYVPVKRWSSDLPDRVEWLRSNPAREAEIVSEARHFASTRLTRRAAIEAWAGLLERHRDARGELKSGSEHQPRPLS